MMNTKKIVIFDLDGTLLNTIEDIRQAGNYVLKKWNLPIYTIEEYKLFVGNGIDKLLARLLPKEKNTEENIIKFKTEFVEYYNAHNIDLTKPFEGINRLLENLQDMGIMLAVASNKYQTATEKTVKHFFPNINFIAVYGARDGIPVKPAPQIVFDVLKKANNIEKAQVLYVGDTAVDMQTANNAEVDACGVTWGFRSRDELEEFEPKYIVDTPEDIMKIVRGKE